MSKLRQNKIIIYYTDIPKNKINAVYIDASWVGNYSQGFGLTRFGLYPFGDPE